MGLKDKIGVKRELYEIPLGFHFKVEFGSADGNSNLGIKDKDFDMRFQDVTGLTAELGMESYAEGGENRFTHRLPGRAKFGNLVLKRGMLRETKLKKWFEDALYNFVFDPIDVTVHLMNAKNETMESWVFHSVWPIKWSVSDLKAMDNALVIETIELAYQYFERKSNGEVKQDGSQPGN